MVVRLLYDERMHGCRHASLGFGFVPAPGMGVFGFVGSMGMYDSG